MQPGAADSDEILAQDEGLRTGPKIHKTLDLVKSDLLKPEIPQIKMKIMLHY